ncbi:MAG TPA: 2-C-methyl-D-erythritol 2,4-cyclodiphosphate synthase, partial [Chitinophagaceae bacterium]|nr:2-C-methyl-D-erythritol 2,4-cyclodiphosphate synthase [Chitinophagaceae bacterium]
MYRIGQGVDFHQLCEGRDFFLGGIQIDYHRGALGHSDADVL